MSLGKINSQCKIIKYYRLNSKKEFEDNFYLIEGNLLFLEGG